MCLISTRLEESTGRRRLFMIWATRLIPVCLPAQQAPTKTPQSDASATFWNILGIIVRPANCRSLFQRQSRSRILIRHPNRSSLPYVPRRRRTRNGNLSSTCPWRLTFDPDCIPTGMERHLPLSRAFRRRSAQVSFLRPRHGRSVDLAGFAGCPLLSRGLRGGGSDDLRQAWLRPG